MTFTEFLATLITFGTVMIGVVWAIVWYLGSRIDRAEDRMEAASTTWKPASCALEETVQGLREDVAVLKATR